MINATAINYKSGDRVTVWFPNQLFGGERHVIEQATEKAIKIKGQWFPKSAFEIEEERLASQLEMKSWFSKKMTNAQSKALGFLI